MEISFTIDPYVLGASLMAPFVVWLATLMIWAAPSPRWKYALSGLGVILMTGMFWTGMVITINHQVAQQIAEKAAKREADTEKHK